MGARFFSNNKGRLQGLASIIQSIGDVSQTQNSIPSALPTVFGPSARDVNEANRRIESAALQRQELAQQAEQFAIAENVAEQERIQKATEFEKTQQMQIKLEEMKTKRAEFAAKKLATAKVTAAETKVGTQKELSTFAAGLEVQTFEDKLEITRKSRADLTPLELETEESKNALRDAQADMASASAETMRAKIALKGEEPLSSKEFADLILDARDAARKVADTLGEFEPEKREEILNNQLIEIYRPMIQADPRFLDVFTEAITSKTLRSSFESISRGPGGFSFEGGAQKLEVINILSMPVSDVLALSTEELNELTKDLSVEQLTNLSRRIKAGPTKRELNRAESKQSREEFQQKQKELTETIRQAVIGKISGNRAKTTGFVFTPDPVPVPPFN